MTKGKRTEQLLAPLESVTSKTNTEHIQMNNRPLNEINRPTNSKIMVRRRSSLGSCMLLPKYSSNKTNGSEYFLTDRKNNNISVKRNNCYDNEVFLTVYSDQNAAPSGSEDNLFNAKVSSSRSSIADTRESDQEDDSRQILQQPQDFQSKPSNDDCESYSNAGQLRSASSSSTFQQNNCNNCSDFSCVDAMDDKYSKNDAVGSSNHTPGDCYYDGITNVTADRDVTIMTDYNNHLLTVTEVPVVEPHSPTASLQQHCGGVTILHRETLPTYVSDRFYLLSEIEIMARPTVFLSSFCTNHNNGSDDDTSKTQDTDVDDDDDNGTDINDNTIYDEKMVLGSIATNSDNIDASGVTANSLSNLLGLETESIPLTENLTTPTTTIYKSLAKEEDGLNNSSKATTLKNSSTEEIFTSFITTTATTTTKTTTTIPSTVSASSSPMSELFPPYILLYILWRPEMFLSSDKNDDPKHFADVVIRHCITQMNEHVDFVTSSPSLSLSTQPSILPSIDGTRKSATTCPDSTNPFNPSTSSTTKPKVNLYLLIELIRPAEKLASNVQSVDHDVWKPSHTSDNIDNETDDERLDVMAESLARYIATSTSPLPSSTCSTPESPNHTISSNDSPNWRNIIQGVTVGISNHVRATPALKAAVQAVSFGALDRRRHTNANSPTMATSNKRKELQQQLCQGERTLLTATNNTKNSVDDGKAKFKPSNSSTYTPVAIPNELIGRSMIGIVAMDADELLGLSQHNYQSHAALVETGKTVPINQRNVVAEWNGNGNLHSFTCRAHAAWRNAVGLPSNDDMIDGVTSSFSSTTSRLTSSFKSSPTSSRLMMMKQKQRRLAPRNARNRSSQAGLSSSSDDSSNQSYFSRPSVPSSRFLRITQRNQQKPSKKMYTSSITQGHEKNSDNNNNNDNKKNYDEMYLFETYSEIAVLCFIVCYAMFHCYHHCITMLFGDAVGLITGGVEGGWNASNHLSSSTVHFK